MTATGAARYGVDMPIVVMTGGTSGFGVIAAERILASGDVRVLLGARRTTSIGEPITLDMAHLDSVRAFVKSVHERLEDRLIDALVLNAGVVLPDANSRTVDGFETTFAVNHLAHYLLLRLLLPALADDAVVVMTTSGTHDPATRAGLTPPRHANAELLAHPDRDRPSRKAGEHAYTASKLCSLLTARALSAHADLQHRCVTALAYCPGQVFGTGLAKDLSLPLRVAWSLLGTPLGWPLRQLDGNLNTVSAAGRTLSDLALRVATPPPGRLYAALRRGQLTWPDPSELARDDELANALWRDSARLVGLPA